jgi:threonine dehydrogenase-like Zn-dependent dehydrogenase
MLVTVRCSYVCRLLHAATTASTHICAALSALAVGGRAVFMGGIRSNVVLPFADIMRRNLTIRGNFMYPVEAPSKLIRLIESGNIPLQNLKFETFLLDDIEVAIDAACVRTKSGQTVVVTPNPELKRADFRR